MDNTEVINLLKEIRNYLSSIDDQLYEIKTECQCINESLQIHSGNAVDEFSSVNNALEEISTAVTNISNMI